MLPDHSGATKVPDPSTIEVYTIWEKMCRLVLYFQFQLREVTFCARQTDVIVDYLLLLILVGAGCGRG